MTTTVADLASELGLGVEDAITALCAIGEFVLGPDSRVRDAAAAQLRANPAPRLQISNPTEGILQEGDAATAFRRRPRSSAKKYPVAWRPGGTPLNQVVRLLAEPYVENNRHRDRDFGVIFEDELQAAQARYHEWIAAGFELQCLLDDDVIAEWIRTFPRRNLSPREVISLITEGFTAEELSLRLWYGRLNPQRLPLMDQLMRGTITAEQARAYLNNYRSAG